MPVSLKELVWSCMATIFIVTILLEECTLSHFDILLTVLRWFLCCSSSCFVHCGFHMWRLFCLYLIPIYPSFGASERLCFVIVAFPGYLHLYFSFVTPFVTDISSLLYVRIINFFYICLFSGLPLNAVVPSILFRG